MPIPSRRPPAPVRAHRWTLVVIAAIFATALAIPSTRAGVLTGPILDVGIEAELVDVLQIPASAASRPLARINVLREAPDGSGRLFVNDLRGPLYAITSGVATLYVDLSVVFSAFFDSPGLATGFVSFAFHPDFETNGLFYTVHSETTSGGTPNLLPADTTTIAQHSVLTEWSATIPSATTFAGTRRELIRIGAPSRFHNMGEIVFDPTLGPTDADYGYLYIGAGDYGAVFVGEPTQLQRLDTPLGALLRIDPLGTPFMRGGTVFDYGIPASNPLASDPTPGILKEIYAYGFRNGHRIVWDLGGSSPGPYVSDIGQSNIEELNRLVPGANYGWPDREGTFAIDVTVDPSMVTPLPMGDTGFAYPVAQYDHDEGSAIAGGFVYRGAGTYPLEGQFVFGDISNGRIYFAHTTALLAADDGAAATTAQVYELNMLRSGVPTTLQGEVASALSLGSVNRVDLRFAQDFAGNIYVTTKQDGFIRQLVPTPEPGLGLGVGIGAAWLGWFGGRRPRPQAREH